MAKQIDMRVQLHAMCLVLILLSTSVLAQDEVKAKVNASVNATSTTTSSTTTAPCNEVDGWMTYLFLGTTDKLCVDVKNTTAENVTAINLELSDPDRTAANNKLLGIEDTCYRINVELITLLDWLNNNRRRLLRERSVRRRLEASPALRRE
jgi:hypothetical protein